MDLVTAFVIQILMVTIPTHKVMQSKEFNQDEGSVMGKPPPYILYSEAF